jgi:hypothetical protein
VTRLEVEVELKPFGNREVEVLPSNGAESYVDNMFLLPEKGVKKQNGTAGDSLHVCYAPHSGKN